MTQYKHTIMQSESCDADFAVWKLGRISGNYISTSIHAANALESMNLICAKLDLNYDIAETSGRAENPYIYVVWSCSSFTIYFHESQSTPVKNILSEIPPLKPESVVKWWYMGAQGPQYSEMLLTGANPMDEFYPWMQTSIKQFAHDFSTSTSNILLLLGPPGTGKTTFIRGLCRYMKHETWVTYDTKVQETESFYVQFASIDGQVEINWDNDERNEHGGRCLVVEDADEMLSKREEGNKIMNRLLNISDGLVTLPARKIIFSTNLPGLKSIDDALLRPGRCFGAINFRLLTVPEAKNACKAAGVKLNTTKDKLTLSEALNGDHKQNTIIQMLGFT